MFALTHDIMQGCAPVLRVGRNQGRGQTHDGRCASDGQRDAARVRCLACRVASHFMKLKAITCSRGTGLEE